MTAEKGELNLKKRKKEKKSEELQAQRNKEYKSRCEIESKSHVGISFKETIFCYL